MKKFTKLVLSCAAVAAVAAAMGTAAMAADFTATYTAPTETEAGFITISGLTTANAQNTVLVLNKDADNVAEADIVQIDQSASAPTKLVVDNAAAPLDNGTYYVRIGGTDGAIKKATFRVGGSDRLLGNVNNDEVIDSLDALDVVYYATKQANKVPLFSDADVLDAADADDNGAVDSLDGLDIVYYATKQGNKANVDGTKTVSDKTHHVTVAE